MADSDPNDRSPSDESAGEVRRLVTPIRLVVFVLGLALIGAAVWTIVGNREQVDHAVGAIERSAWYLVLAAVLLPLANWVCTTATIWILTERYAKVPPREMLALIGSAWLLNILPLRLGMIGRVAYHKKFHGMRVRDCAKVMMQALVCSGVALGILTLGVLAAGSWPGGSAPIGDTGSVREWAVLAGGVVVVPASVLGLAWALSRRMEGRGGLSPGMWRWPAAVLIRYVDMLIWFGRYVLVFAMIGHPLTAFSAAAVTVSAQAAMVTPVQFGLREWMVGVTTAMLDRSTPAGVEEAPRPPARGARAKEALRKTTPGLMSDACMRAAELVIVLPVGVASTIWVMRRVRNRRAGAAGTPAGG